MRPLLLALLVCSAAALTARAAEKPDAAPAKPYVDTQAIGLPAVIHGRLVNYVFVKLRLDVAPGVDASKIQQAEPFLRDALVKDASHTPFNLPEDGVRLDEARLKADVLRRAQLQFGPGKVVGVEIRSQTPQRRRGVPGGDAPVVAAPG